MKDASPQTMFLSEYRPFGHIVDDVHLTFRLSARATRVVSKISFTPNADFPGEFFLHGQEVKLIWAKIDGVDAARSSMLKINGKDDRPIRIVV